MKRLIFFSLFTIPLFISNCTSYSDKKESDADNWDLLSYRGSDGLIRPVNTLDEWELKRGQILEDMQKAMGGLPDLSALPPPDVQITDSLKETNYTRFTISFTAAKNEKIPAYLYIPFQGSGQKRLPAMLVLHGTGDLGKQLVDGHSPRANRAHAKELAQRGYVVIAPDYPGFGEL